MFGSLVSAPGANALLSKNRVWENFSTSSLTALAESLPTQDLTRENPLSAYDLASDVRIYLYTHANPVNGTDPSGNFLLTEISLTLSFAAGLNTLDYNRVFAFTALYGEQLLKLSGDLAKDYLSFRGYTQIAPSQVSLLPITEEEIETTKIFAFALMVRSLNIGRIAAALTISGGIGDRANNVLSSNYSNIINTGTTLTGTLGNKIVEPGLSLDLSKLILTGVELTSTGFNNTTVTNENVRPEALIILMLSDFEQFLRQ